MWASAASLLQCFVCRFGWRVRWAAVKPIIHHHQIFTPRGKSHARRLQAECAYACLCHDPPTRRRGFGGARIGGGAFCGRGGGTAQWQGTCCCDCLRPWMRGSHTPGFARLGTRVDCSVACALCFPRVRDQLRLANRCPWCMAHLMCPARRSLRAKSRGGGAAAARN